MDEKTIRATHHDALREELPGFVFLRFAADTIARRVEIEAANGTQIDDRIAAAVEALNDYAYQRIGRTDLAARSVHTFLAMRDALGQTWVHAPEYDLSSVANAYRAVYWTVGPAAAWDINPERWSAIIAAGEMAAAVPAGPQRVEEIDRQTRLLRDLAAASVVDDVDDR